MKFACLAGLALAVVAAGPGYSATLAPTYATLYDLNIDGSVDASQPALFAAIQRASPAAGTVDREFVGFMLFDVWGISSFASAVIDLTFSDTVTYSPGASRLGIYGQVDGIGFGGPGDAALNGSKTLLAELTFGDAASGFDFAPVGYQLDLTSYFNSVLPTLGLAQRIAVRFDVLNLLGEIPPAGGNHGFGAAASSPYLQYEVGVPPVAAVPVPAGVALLGSGLAALGIMAWRRRSGKAAARPAALGPA